MLLLDIGNTHTRIARWRNGVVEMIETIDTAVLSTEKVRRWLIPDEPCAAASVVPAAAKRLTGIDIRFISAATAAGGVDFTRVDTSTLGADRVANAVALATSGILPGLVLDCGTAITIEIVDAEGVFRGGAISPGRGMFRRALHVGTAQLPELPPATRPPAAAGENTAAALALGIDLGAVGMVRELLTVLSRQFPGIRSLATGGDAAFFCSALPELLEPATSDFTLRGIAIASGLKE